jgi:hypothetical protein
MDAYKRAERAYCGQLEQLFVVLRDHQYATSGHSHQLPDKNEKKRPLEDQADAYDKSEKGNRERWAGGSRGKEETSLQNLQD